VRFVYRAERAIHEPHSKELTDLRSGRSLTGKLFRRAQMDFRFIRTRAEAPDEPPTSGSQNGTVEDRVATRQGRLM